MSSASLFAEFEATMRNWSTYSAPRYLRDAEQIPRGKKSGRGESTKLQHTGHVLCNAHTAITTLLSTVRQLRNTLHHHGGQGITSRATTAKE